jgi:hypothetical protein
MAPPLPSTIEWARQMDDYTFPFLLSIGMAIVCALVAVLHGVYGL